MEQMFPREAEPGVAGTTISLEFIQRINGRILGMTNKDEDQQLPSYRGIELVLLALERDADSMPAYAVSQRG